MNIAAEKAQSSFALNPQDELNDLRISDKAMPLLNHVKKSADPKCKHLSRLR